MKLAAAAALALAPLVPAVPAPASRPAPPQDAERFHTTRESRVVLPLPGEEDAFFFAVFGDRTGGPAEGIAVLEQAVAEVNLLEPDLVMTVGDLIQGYNQTPAWMLQMMQYRTVMDRLGCPWFPVAGNHDVYWRGPEGERPDGEHESNYEAHFGPLWYAFRHKTAWFLVLYSDEGNPETGVRSFSEPDSQRMSPAQFEWLSGALERARGAEHVFVFLHHPRWLGGGYGDDWDRVHDLLAAAGNVSAVFAGHIHRMRYDGVRDGIEYFTLATVGGHQSGAVPRAGYLHQFHVVTVRKERIAVASLPVGTVEDPRRITGTVSDETRALSQLVPEWSADVALAADGSAVAYLEARLANPTGRPIEATLAAHSADDRWRLAPDHCHVTIPPGEARAVPLAVAREAGTLDASFAPPEVDLRIDYLATGWRVEIPAAQHALPLDPGALAAPVRPRGLEGRLVLDGEGDHLSVEHDSIPLPDGPLTLEAWLRGAEFGERQGLATKTENCEYGLFTSRGEASFSVHLDGQYVTATSAGPVLEPGRWHHVAGVFDGNEVRVYVDGELAASQPGSGARTVRALPLIVGADVTAGGGATSHFAGEIDELRLSRVARYAGARFTPARRCEPDADTLLLLHMDGDLGPWVFDGSAARAHPARHGDARVEACP